MIKFKLRIMQDFPNINLFEFLGRKITFGLIIFTKRSTQEDKQQKNGRKKQLMLVLHFLLHDVVHNVRVF